MCVQCYLYTELVFLTTTFIGIKASNFLNTLLCHIIVHFSSHHWLLLFCWLVATSCACWLILFLICVP